jgi:hypothetical protein
MPGATPAALRRTLQHTKRWGWLGAVAIGALIAVFAVSKSQSKAQPGARDEAVVLAADEALGQAMRSGDKTIARRLLSLQFTFVDAGGKIHGRRDVLAGLKGVAATGVSDAKVRRYGLLAMVTGHRKSTSGRDVFFLDVWARQKGAWRALVMQDLADTASDTPTASLTSHRETAAAACKNPCQIIPYRVRSASEQDIVNAYQTMVKAVVARQPDAWGRHVADEFVLYGTGRAPLSKSDRVTAIERQQEDGTSIGEVQAMRLSVYGDGAVMTASEALPGGVQPPHRTTRVFVKRNGQWQMAISAYTDVE